MFFSHMTLLGNRDQKNRYVPPWCALRAQKFFLGGYQALSQGKNKLPNIP